MTRRDEFQVNVPVLAGLVVLVSLAFGFGAITKYSGMSSAAAAPAAPSAPTAEAYLHQSLVYYQEKRFVEAVNAAQEAIRIKPDLAEAWNNLGAAFAELGRWDEALSAEQNALRLKPDFQLARNNLAWAEKGKSGAR